MIKLEELTPFGRKQWAKRKFDEYENSEITKSIKRSIKAYKEPTNKCFDENFEVAKWKSTIDKKVEYLLSRKPIAQNYQTELDNLSKFIKISARDYLLRGSLIWVVQGNGVDISKQPLIMNNTIAIYTDESKETPFAYIRKYVDMDIQKETGTEEEIVFYELYYNSGMRDTFCYSKPELDRVGEKLEDEPVFIELGKTGDSPLYAYVERLLCGLDNLYKYEDKTTQENTDPLTEVKGYTGTDDADLEYAVKRSKLVKTDGNGGITIHSRTVDSSAIELWRKALLQEYYEATCTVGKENELAYAQSGKALDRLFIDMEYSARDLAHILEEALKEYFEIIGIKDFDIVWNTDRPIDDTEIINGITMSSGILSKKTILEQHPWVDNVEEELERIEEESNQGMEDFIYEENDEFEEE